MNVELFIAKKILFKSKRKFSKLIIRLSIIAVMLSLAVMLVAVSISKGFQGEIKNRIIGFGSHIQVKKANFNYSAENAPIKFRPNLIDSIKRFSQVKHVQIYATKPAIVKADTDIEGIILKGVARDFNWEFTKKYLKEGEVLNFNEDKKNNGIIISETFAKKMKIKFNDKLFTYFVQNQGGLRVRVFKVKGIYSTGVSEIDKIFAIIDLRHIQKLNNWKEDWIGGYEITLNSMNDLDVVNEKIRSIIDITEETETITKTNQQIFDWLSLMDMNVYIILILMIFVAIVNMVTTLFIIILEKTQMIGILKSIGATYASVKKIFIYIAMFFIFCGIIMGNILGFSFILLQDNFQIFKLDAESYYLSYVPISYNYVWFISLNIITFLICSFIMILPAIYISKILPIRTLRFN